MLQMLGLAGKPSQSLATVNYTISDGESFELRTFHQKKPGVFF